MITVSGEIRILVMTELCQRVIDGEGMPGELKRSEVVSLFKDKSDVMNYDSYRGVKLENTT